MLTFNNVAKPSTSPFQLDILATVVVVMGWIIARGLVVVIVGGCAGLALFDTEVGDIVVVERHPPNHPYLTQDVVGKSSVEVEELVELVVVVSSRHPEEGQFEAFNVRELYYIPHHPGVWQVEVLVGLAVDELLLLVVVDSVPLLSKYFQL